MSHPRIYESPSIPGLTWIQTAANEDARGSFAEVWRKEWVPGAREFVQQNRGYSVPGVLRGLHFHLRQRDLWRCESGRIFCAFVDLRQRIPVVQTGWLEESGASVYIPEGVAHGYCVDPRDDPAVMLYQVDRYYDMDDEHSVRWNDPTLAVEWPFASPVLSPRDARAPAFVDVSPLKLQVARDLLPR